MSCPYAWASGQSGPQPRPIKTDRAWVVADQARLNSRVDQMIDLMRPPFDPGYTGSVATDVLISSYATEEGVAQRRAYRLRALLAHAAQHSSRYRRLLAGCDSGTIKLADLPIAQKTELMDRFDEWVCDRTVSLDALRRFTQIPFRSWRRSRGATSSGRVPEPAASRRYFFKMHGPWRLRRARISARAGSSLPSLLLRSARNRASDRFRWRDEWSLPSNVAIERLRRLIP